MSLQYHAGALTVACGHSASLGQLFNYYIKSRSRSFIPRTAVDPQFTAVRTRYEARNSGNVTPE